MTHDTSLITTIIAGLCLAFAFGFIANRLRIAPIVGYILAGILVGPYTGGIHADPNLTHQLSEIGVILLMFGVGLHFSIKDLLSVKFIAIPGAILQIVVATILGFGLSWLLGGNFATNIVFGFALSTASTVVLLKNIQNLNLLETERGKIAVGWLIVEDLVMVLILVMIPVFMKGPESNDSWLLHFFISGAPTFWQIILLTLVKISLFIAIMLIFGRRFIPWLLQLTAQSDSGELFRLGILAITLGIAAGASYFFDVSLALGAFFSGLVMGETKFSQNAAEESLPLRDAFSVLFFVSVGMLFNPYAIWESFFSLIAALFIIIVAKGITAYFLVRAAKKTVGTALTVSASLAQIGEFSFILVGLGTTFGLFDETLRNIIVGSAILSILLNPFMFFLVNRLKIFLEKKKIIKIDNAYEIEKEENIIPIKLEDHIIFIGYNSLSIKISQILSENNVENLIIDHELSQTYQNHKESLHLLRGKACDKKILKAANLEKAKKVIFILPNAFETSNILEAIKKIRPQISIFAYSRTEEEKEYLQKLSIHYIMDNDNEIAKNMIEVLLSEKKELTHQKINDEGDVFYQEQKLLLLPNKYSNSNVEREEV